MSKRSAPVPLDHFPNSMAPVGTVSSTCCPKLAGVPTWWGSGPVTQAGNNLRGWTVDRAVISPGTHGFDDRTNMPAEGDRGTKEYWNRSGAPGTSGGRRDLDGSTWISVPKGSTADVEIKFVGQAGAACIANVTIEVDDTAKATVAPTTFTAASTKLTVTGVAVGECTVTANCDGKPIGWCHVAVYDPKIVNVKIWRVCLTDAAGTTNLTSDAAITAGQLTTIQTTLDTIYAQCAVSWNVSYEGVVTYTDTASVNLYNRTLARNVSPEDDFFPLIRPHITGRHTLPGRNLYYFEPMQFASGVSGYDISGGHADAIPASDCILFTPVTDDWGRRILVHELGHCLGLFHPSDSSNVTGQLPNNFRLPLARDSGGNSVNGMWADHINMMGYGASPPPDSAIRYGQWEVIRANI